MRHKRERSLPHAPPGFSWRVEQRFGFAVALPRRFRLFEFDVLWDDTMPLCNTRADKLWARTPYVVTETLASLRLPGYELLGRREMMLGHLDALGFDYRWDGLHTCGAGGDRVLFAWAPSPWGVFHVYQHCPEMEWTSRRSELEAILGTFTALDAVPAATDAGT